jgi:hypothetical protein
MSFDARVARLIRRHGRPKPFLVAIENSPDGLGADEGLIADGGIDGPVYERAEGESVEAFHDRLLDLAARLGAPNVIVGVGPSHGRPEARPPRLSRRRL